MTTTSAQIRGWGQRWCRAEERGDVEALDALTTQDFTLVGPLGFVLDKQGWLDRYRSGAMTTRWLCWDEVAVREYGTAAVAIGRQRQEGEYQGHPADGSFRTTHVFVRHGEGHWLLAGAQLSPIGGPPPAPPATPDVPS